MNKEERMNEERINEQRKTGEQGAAAQAEPDTAAALFQDDELGGYRTRWSGIQTGFVDEPRRAVEEADALVSELATRLTQSFAEQRRRLEEHWEKAESNVSTEDLRRAMQRYRSFFERLLRI